MSLLERAARFPYNLVLRYAPAPIKMFLWDREFSSGKWAFIEHTAGDCIYRSLEKYARHGSILDLGCGPGNTANELAMSAYTSYEGVDVSEIALEKARTRSEQSGRAHKNRFVRADLLTYTPTGIFDVILLRESLYHVPLRRLKALFDHYSPYLKDSGVFIVRLITNGRHGPKARVRVIETAFNVVEKAQYGRDGTLVVVFRTNRRPAPEPVNDRTRVEPRR